MPLYRCYFLNRSEQVTNWQAVEASSHMEAETRAQDLLEERAENVAVEVWHADQLMFRRDRRPVG